MFSYRHAFHAGNHADVIKHIVWLAVLRYMQQKETGFTLVDTHAGVGLYRLDGDYARTSGEAQEGIVRLQAHAHAAAHPATPTGNAPSTLSPLVTDYLNVVAQFNSGNRMGGKVYPGSPFISQHVLRPQDKLKLFELHPRDANALAANIEQLRLGRQVTVTTADGFEAAPKLLPPPSRRGVVLCDPSYEMKTDYARVLQMATLAMQRFVTGTIVVWYPIIPRPEAHGLPKKLKTLAQSLGKSTLNVSLTVKSSKLTRDDAGDVQRPGLPASGMFIINPPHTLKAQLQEAMPQLVAALGQERNAGFVIA